jgi:hypothetical protein
VVVTRRAVAPRSAAVCRISGKHLTADGAARFGRTCQSYRFSRFVRLILTSNAKRTPQGVRLFFSTNRIKAPPRDDFLRIGELFRQLRPALQCDPDGEYVANRQMRGARGHR